MMNCAVSTAFCPGDRVGTKPANKMKPITMVTRHSVPLHAQNLCTVRFILISTSGAVNGHSHNRSHALARAKVCTIDRNASSLDA